MQYDCIKSELKEEYDKKVKSLKLKLNRKAMRDPSLLLFSQLTEEQKKSGNRTPMAGGLNQSFTGISSGLSHGQGRNMTATYHMKQRQLNQGLKDK